jgi:hypothetical protein
MCRRIINNENRKRFKSFTFKTKSQDTVAETIKPRFVRLKKINPEL